MTGGFLPEQYKKLEELCDFAALMTNAEDKKLRDNRCVISIVYNGGYPRRISMTIEEKLPSMKDYGGE